MNINPLLLTIIGKGARYVGAFIVAYVTSIIPALMAGRWPTHAECITATGSALVGTGLFHLRSPTKQLP